MITIINDNTDPRYNLALEEYVLKNLRTADDIIMLWQNKPSIIIGRNQNTIEEINTEYLKDNDIHVVRRISGGGAVYHDFGNLNYTFVTNNVKDNLNNYRKFTQPVIDALIDLGVQAEFAGRNDIVIEGKKISGNAQSYYQNRMFHHGTILFDADLDMIAKVLKVNQDKILSKGIKSMRSRVTNILPYLEDKLTMQDFKLFLLQHILKTTNIESKVYKLSNLDYQNIESLMENKYKTWDWNYGSSPKYSLEKSRRYLGGKISFCLDINNGCINSCKIYGDFLGKLDVSNIENKLINQKFKEENIRLILKEFQINDFFYNITNEDIIDCLFY